MVAFFGLQGPWTCQHVTLCGSTEKVKGTLITHNIEELKEEVCEKLLEFLLKFYTTSLETCVENWRNACTETEVTWWISLQEINSMLCTSG